MVGRRKLPDPLLNHIFFNALSIGVQSTLTFQWNNFDLCLLSDEILVGAISWVLFCNFAVSPLVQKSVLNGEQEQGSRSYSLFNTDLSCTKGGGYSKVTK